MDVIVSVLDTATHIALLRSWPDGQHLTCDSRSQGLHTFCIGSAKIMCGAQSKQIPDVAQWDHGIWMAEDPWAHEIVPQPSERTA